MGQSLDDAHGILADVLRVFQAHISLVAYGRGYLVRESGGHVFYLQSVLLAGLFHLAQSCRTGDDRCGVGYLFSQVNDFCVLVSPKSCLGGCYALCIRFVDGALQVGIRIFCIQYKLHGRTVCLLLGNFELPVLHRFHMGHKSLSLVLLPHSRIRPGK